MAWKTISAVIFLATLFIFSSRQPKFTRLWRLFPNWVRVFDLISVLRSLIAMTLGVAGSMVEYSILIS